MIDEPVRLTQTVKGAGCAAKPAPGDLERARTEAIRKGLDYLAGEQRKDGSWVAGDQEGGVIGVTATDAGDKLLPVANRGPQVTVAAPGVEILEPAPDGAYQITTGTSVAAAHASGVAALLLARKPDLKPSQVRALLVRSARHIPGHKRDVGAGVTHVLAPGKGSTDLDKPSVGRPLKLRMFNHQDRIGAARQHAAGGDRSRMTGDHRNRRHDAGREHLAVQPQRARCFLHCTERVLRPHREAVDVGAIESRDVDVRKDIPGEHTAEGLPERHELFAKRSKPQVRAKLRGGLVARDDAQELGLPGG